MAYATWPFACPVSWTQKPRTAVIRSEVDAGVPKVRARFTKSYREIQASWTFDSWTLLAPLEAFLTNTLNDSSLPFTMKHPISGLTITVRFKEAPSVSSDVSRKPTFQLNGELEEFLA